MKRFGLALAPFSSCLLYTSSDIENFKLINDVFGIAAGDRLLCGVADLYKEFVGGDGICGRFNADQFACLIEHRNNYSNELFIKANARVNSYSSAKNVVMKWGIYSVKGGAIQVEQMCDRALLAARSIKGPVSYTHLIYRSFGVIDDRDRSRKQDL